MTKLGAICAEVRRNASKTQKDVADELGYCHSNICEFEKGRNNNCFILMWYVQHGLSISEAYNALFGGG